MKCLNLLTVARSQKSGGRQKVLSLVSAARGSPSRQRFVCGPMRRIGCTPALGRKNSRQDMSRPPDEEKQEPKDRSRRSKAMEKKS